MKLIKSKKGFALLAALVVVAVAAFGAYAYFTSTGEGTGSATVGSDSNWVVGQTGVTSGGPLYPDSAIGAGNIQTNAYHVSNPSLGNQNLANVAIKVANADGSAWTSGTCAAQDFSVGGAAVGTTYNDTTLAGTFTPSQNKTNGSVTVQLIDDNTNQNDCRGVTVPLYFFAS